MIEPAIQTDKATSVGIKDLLSRNRDFLSATPCVLMMLWSARLVNYHPFVVWFGIVAFVAHAGMGFCGIMANHYRDQMKRLNDGGKQHP